MVADHTSLPEQLPLKGIHIPSPEEEAIRILREEYLRHNGDLRPFFAELARRQPKRRDSSDSWLIAGSILTKSRP